MARKPRITAPALDPAMTTADAERLLAEIGQAQRDLSALIDRADSEKAAIDLRLSNQRTALEQAIEERAQTLTLWATARREELCKGEAKTVKLTTGEIAWRFNPPSVRVTGAETVIANLKRLGLDRFVRISEEIDRQAVLKEPAAVAGIAGLGVAQAEQLILKPNQTDIEPVELIRKAG